MAMELRPWEMGRRLQAIGANKVIFLVENRLEVVLKTVAIMAKVVVVNKSVTIVTRRPQRFSSAGG